MANVTEIIKRAGNTVSEGLGDAVNGVINAVRPMAGASTEPAISSSAPNTKWIRDEASDMRVKVTLPPSSDVLGAIFNGNDLLKPLSGDGGVVFPLTPSIVMQHSASYNAMDMAHTNYPHYAYQRSEVSAISVVGDFPVQNASDAAYWVAMLHFFRTVTKMFFGNDAQFKGNPPPILWLNGYGTHVFKNIPVVVTNFSCDLRQDVDYICTSQTGGADGPPGQGLGPGSVNQAVLSPENVSWAPTMSNVQLQLQPVLSRDTVKQFSLTDFAKGNLAGTDKGIGII